MTRRGFTLLEVLLAVGLATILLGGLFAFYRHTNNARARLMEKMQQQSARQLVMQRITDELRAATVGLSGLALNGGPESMRFVCTTVPGGAVWAVDDATGGAAEPQFDLALVGYALRYEEDEQTGEPYIVGLERIEQRYVPTETTDEQLAQTVTLIDEGVRFIMLRYWSGDQWLEQWSGGDLPGAVEIVIGEQPLPEGVEPIDYPYETMRRVVTLPAASNQTPGGARLGMAGGGGP